MDKLLRIDRRTTLKWVLCAMSTWNSPAPLALGSPTPTSDPVRGTSAGARGYGTDPDLLRTYHPGELWPLTLTAEQRQIAAALCDAIIPADDHSPSASAVGVVDFIDEWVSAPYVELKADGDLLLRGLANLERQAQDTYKKSFAALSADEYHAILTPICFLPKAQPEHQEASKFFARFRDLTAGAFYTTAQGSRDVGFVGNIALARFDGPPLEVLKQVGLA